MKVVPDTSVIVDGRVTELLEEGELKDVEIFIHEAVMGELEYQANRGQEIGMSGLEEVKSLQKMEEEGLITLSFEGERPRSEQIEFAQRGDIDAMIRDLALEKEALLLTSDVVQAESGRARGLEVRYLEPVEAELSTTKEIWDYFDEETYEENIMSVHLRDGTKPRAKIGIPGDMKMKTLEETNLSEKELKDLAHRIIEEAKRSSEGFIEMDEGGATVVQLREYRIVISRPPFSDGFEITAVKPVAEVSIDDYRLSQELKDRISERRRGILLAGSPGAGKSTLAQAIAEYLMEKDFVVKTMEKPRDLQVPDDITQYTALGGKIEDTADVLLLVRPDYTIFDEVRKTPHFQVFADMRLAGVGMVGVTHANRAIDALQRLIGRVELGMVPQVVDTVVYLEEAQITKVYDVSFTVKVPAGMVEEDLARPVIEVKDFETGTTEYEIYSYGEQVVVMPVKETEMGKEKPVWRLAEEQLDQELGMYVRDRVESVVTSSDSAKVYVPDKKVPSILGKDGKNIDRIERELGLNLDVRSFDEKVESKGTGTGVSTSVQPRVESEKVVLELGGHRSGDKVELYQGDEYLTTATVGQDGSIKIRKNTRVGGKILRGLDEGKMVRIE